MDLSKQKKTAVLLGTAAEYVISKQVDSGRNLKNIANLYPVLKKMYAIE